MNKQKISSPAIDFYNYIVKVEPEWLDIICYPAFETLILDLQSSKDEPFLESVVRMFSRTATIHQMRTNASLFVVCFLAN